MIRRRLSRDGLFLILAAAVYLTTRLVGLADYPISFIGDEAVQVVDAAYLVEHGFRDEFGDLLPTYVRNGPYLNLGTSVYLQALPYSIFGYSVYAARAVTVFVSLFGALAIGFVLRDAFRIRFWWTGVLLLSIAPAWFLHSRTALEAVIGCSFYAWFLYLYLSFRAGASPWSLYGAVTFGALAFYSYAPIKIVVVATALLFIVSDARWLATRWSTCLRAAALALVLAVPQIRFQIQHPDASIDQLRVLGSYVVDPKLSLGEKLNRFVHEYATGLDPRYWFDPDQTREIIRHTMKGYGNLWLPTLPFILLGYALACWRARESAYRALLLATAAAPLGAAVVEIQLPRSLVVVIPATIATALGLDAILSPVARRVGVTLVGAATLALFAILNFWVLTDALRNGPTWYADYGLYGLNYGGRQVTAAVEDQLKAGTARSASITSSWANGTDTLVRFFLPNDARVRVDNPNSLLTDPYPGGVDSTLFVLAPEELAAIRKSPLFDTVRIVRTVKVPDGHVGFYFVELAYSPRAAAIFAAKRRELQRPVTERISINGAPAVVTHSRTDIGRLTDLFDGDLFTLARTADDSVFQVDIRFKTPQPARRLRIVGREMRLAVAARVYVAGRVKPRLFRQAGVRQEVQPTLDLRLGSDPVLVRRVSLRISDPSRPTDQHVHVREIEFVR